MALNPLADELEPFEPRIGRNTVCVRDVSWNGNVSINLSFGQLRLYMTDIGADDDECRLGWRSFVVKEHRCPSRMEGSLQDVPLPRGLGGEAESGAQRAGCEACKATNSGCI